MVEIEILFWKEARSSPSFIMHETRSPDRGDGPATRQPSVAPPAGPEAYFFTARRKARLEAARKDGEIRGLSRWFARNAG
jgi:hypothetical protein